MSYLDGLGVQAAYKFLVERWPDQPVHAGEVEGYLDMLRTLHPHELRPALCMIAVGPFGEEHRPTADMIYDEVQELRIAYSQEVIHAQKAKDDEERIRKEIAEEGVPAAVEPRPAKPNEMARPEHVHDVTQKAREAVERAKAKARGNIDNKEAS